MIYQELAVAPHLSVEDNILLGLEPVRRGLLDRAALRRKAREALTQLGHPDLDPAARAGDLSIGMQQLVEIARALVVNAKIIILDEPTSSLTRADAERLFAVVRTLKQRGVSIVYISHFLEEVEEIADSFTVLRDGASVGGGRIGEVGIPQIVSWMVGRELTEMFPRSKREAGEVVLSVRDLRAVGVEHASFELRRGEVLRANDVNHDSADALQYRNGWIVRGVG